MEVNDYQENYVTGWIKLYRSLSNKGWYRKSEYVHLWVHILIKANHSGAEFWFNGENIKLKAGQFVTGRKILSTETGISESKIQRMLKQFENEQQIEQQTNNTNRLISVLNWGTYQNVEQQMNNKRTTDEQPVNTNKNVNNYKKKENIVIPDYDEFISYARKLKPKVIEQEVRIKYEAWKVNGWKDGYDKPIKNWKSKLLNSLKYFGESEQRDYVVDNSPVN